MNTVRVLCIYQAQYIPNGNNFSAVGVEISQNIPLVFFCH